MYIYQGFKREPGVGVKEKGVGVGGSRGRLSNCLHVNSKLNSPCPETICTPNANHFSPLLSSLFFKHLTVDGKMQIDASMETLVTQLCSWI